MSCDVLKYGPGVRCRDVRQDERENRERRQHGQSSARAMDLKSLFVVTGTTPQQA